MSQTLQSFGQNLKAFVVLIHCSPNYGIKIGLQKPKSSLIAQDTIVSPLFTTDLLFDLISKFGMADFG
jgi:hypothetical protein